MSDSKYVYYCPTCKRVHYVQNPDLEKVNCGCGASAYYKGVFEWEKLPAEEVEAHLREWDLQGMKAEELPNGSGKTGWIIGLRGCAIAFGTVCIISGMVAGSELGKLSSNGLIPFLCFLLGTFIGLLIITAVMVFTDMAQDMRVNRNKL